MIKVVILCFFTFLTKFSLCHQLYLLRCITTFFLVQMFQEANIAMLTEDQTNQLLSAFWIQANQTDNTPFNYEAIGHSYSLTVLSSRLKVRIHWKKNILLKSMDIKSSQRHKVDIYLLSSHFGYQFCFIRELIDMSVIHFWNHNKHPCICFQNPYNYDQVILYFS